MISIIGVPTNQSPPSPPIDKLPSPLPLSPGGEGNRVRGLHHRRVNSYFSPFKGETEEEDGFAARGARRLYYFETMNNIILPQRTHPALAVSLVSAGCRQSSQRNAMIRGVSLTSVTSVAQRI
jgi:hypothetical protein